MVTQKQDDPSSHSGLYGINGSNGLSDTTEWNGIHTEHESSINHESIAYVLLGNESVVVADSGDGELETSSSDSERENNSHFAEITEDLNQYGDDHLNENSESNTRNDLQSTSDNQICNNTHLDVDRILTSQLGSVEFEPKGAFSDPKLFSEPISDSTQVELWNEKSGSSTDIVMNEDKAAKIKMCMANFHLPSSGYPAWATKISENEWKIKLSEILNYKKDNSNLQNES